LYVLYSYSAATYFNNKDELQFLFSANKGTDFGLLKSSFWWRDVGIMLCKAILFDIQKTYVNFDEIDTEFQEKLLSKWVKS
jgi:DNA repair protein RecN (Recombination protein N)